jgi:hypothetical protein
LRYISQSFAVSRSSAVAVIDLPPLPIDLSRSLFGPRVQLHRSSSSLEPTSCSVRRTYPVPLKRLEMPVWPSQTPSREIRRPS